MEERKRAGAKVKTVQNKVQKNRKRIQREKERMKKLKRDLGREMKKLNPELELYSILDKIRKELGKLQSRVRAVEKKSEKQQGEVITAQEETERQENYLLREIKRLNGRLCTSSELGTSSLYIFGQNSIGGVKDNPFSI